LQLGPSKREKNDELEISEQGTHSPLLAMQGCEGLFAYLSMATWLFCNRRMGARMLVIQR
jgi:hypothetical protein